MTDFPGEASSVLRDAANPLISPGPAHLATGLLPGPAGWMGVVTIRTSSATVTVMLSRKDVSDWAGMLVQLADAMDGNGPGSVPGLAVTDRGLPAGGPGHEGA